MKWLLDIRFYFVLVSLTAIILFVQKNNQTKVIETQTQTIDSLNQEIFVKDITVGQYEVMWGILEEINKPLADSINNQVE